MATLIRSLRKLLARPTDDVGTVQTERLREFVAMLHAESDMPIPRGHA